MEQVVLQGHKGGEKSPHQPAETRNNLLSKSYAKVLLAIGEGEFAGVPTAADIYLDGTPLVSSTGLQNFGGVKWEYRPGTVDQTHIQGMPEVSNEFPIGFTLTNTVPYTRLITDSQLDAVRVTLSWPALLQQKDNGDIVGYNIVYAIDISTNGGAYVEQGQWDTNTGKTTVEYNRTHRINLPKTGTSWTLRVRRITPNQNNAKFQDTMTVKTFAEVIDAKLRYPNTALLYVEFDAELFGGTSIPRISLKTKGRLVQVPANYDPASRTYSGVWNGTFKWAWTDNPAWVFYDLVTNERFGLGSRITPAMVDKWTLYQVSQYCDVMVSDGKGGQEPRYTCNIYIQSRKEAWQVLRDIVGIFNGMLYWSGTQMVASADMPVAVNTVRNYSRSNVIDGKFSYGSTSEKTIYTTALVSYDNPDNHFETAVEAVNDLNLVQRYKTWAQAELSAIGCTSRGQAQRKGKYTMLTNSLNRVVTFKLGLEGYLPKPGEVIGVADQVMAGASLAGRISAATTNTVTVDRVPSAAIGDILYVNKADGIASEGRTIQSISGKTMTVTTPFSVVPSTELSWYVEKVSLKSQLFRITKVTWNDDQGQYEVTGVQYEDSKYGAVDTGARLESRPITSIPAGGQAGPTNLIVSSFTYLEQTMAVTNLSVKWTPAAGAMNYEGQWRKDGGDWINVGLTATTGFDVKGIYTGAYQARVRAVNAAGIKSVWVESANTQINGKVGTPPALASLTTSAVVMGIRLNWAFPTGAEDTAFIEIREADSNAGANERALSTVAYPANTFLKSGLAAGVTFWYKARLIDRSGNAGPYTAWVRGDSSSSASEILDYLQGQITESELGQVLSDKIDKIDLIDGKVDTITVDLNWLEAEVQGIEQLLQNDVDDLNSTISEVNVTVDALKDQVDAIFDSLEYDPTKTYLKGETVRVGQRLYQALKDVPVNTPPSTEGYWKDIGDVVEELDALAGQVQYNSTSIVSQGGTLSVQAQQIDAVTARVGTAETAISGNSTAIGTLQTTVTQQGNTITSQGTSITSLTSGLSTTNSNVTAAQAAADAANTLAGGKGKVLVQSTAPGAADQLSQNLWIDTTGNANTPKRWTGSAWAAVTDKVATDAAAAAAAAQATANTKADASAVNALTTRVTNAEGTITSQGTSITNLNNSLTTTNTNVTAAQAAADAANTLAGGKGKVLVQTATPAAADQLVQNLWIDITGGANTPKRWTGSAWTAVTDKVATDAATAAANALSVANTKADASAVSSLTTRVTAAEGTITSQGTSITNLNNSLTTTNNNVTTAQNAANAANTLAGGKGKVLVQSTTPVAADQLVQNLWIDITGGANTPKRWTGSVWSAVTDKIATDAAAAAAAAQTTADTNATATSALTTRVTAAEGNITSQGTSITNLNNGLVLFGRNSPTAVYQSLFNGKGVDTWTRTTGTGTSALSNVAGNTSGSSLTLSAPGGTMWWGASNQLIRFDPTRLYKLSVRVQQVAIVSGTPAFYAGLDCFAENGVTRVNTAGANSTSSSHYVLASNVFLTVGSWTTFTTYVKGTTTGTGGAGAGTAANPRALKEGSRYFSPMVITNYNNLGGDVAIDYFTIEDVTDQVQIDAQASALSGLTTTVTTQGTDITSHGNSITSLTNQVNFTEVDELYGAGETDAQIDEILQIASGAASATAALTSTVKQQGDTITAQADSITSLNTSLTGVNDDLAAQSKAVSSLNSTTTALGDTITSQGSSITSLNSSLTVTNNNVTAAQAAADAANTLAGGKGKVLVQSTTPVAGDQLAQNLWIDTTGSANTPKRWNGSAWVAVTDKVATDAAAAAAAAQATANTKADASAVTALTTRVTAAEGTITSQGSAVTQLQNTVGGLGLDPAPNCLWQFDTGVEGWTATSATLSQASGQLTITSTGTDPTLVSPVTAIVGSLYSRVKAKITRTAGSGWDGKIFYGTSGHGFTASYYKTLPNPNLGIGQSIVLDIDMSALTAGGSDWVTSTITSFRFDFGSTASDVFTVDWVGVGRDGPSASSGALSQLNTTVTQQGATLTATSTKVDGVYAQVNPPMAGDSASLAGDDTSMAGVWSVWSAVAEGDMAQSQRTDTVQAAVNSNSALIQAETVARVNGDGALASQQTVLQTSLDNANLSIAQNSTAIQTVNGKVSGTWSVRLQYNSGTGEYKYAGVGLGLDNTSGSLQSKFVVDADLFAIGNGSTIPFAVTGGQTFIKAAFIQDGTITNAKIGSVIQSDNYVANTTGWKLDKAGNFEINGNVAGQGRLTITNQLVSVYDAAGVLRVRMGIW